MFEKFSTSYKLVLLALSYIKQEGELLTYAILSLIASALMVVSFYVFDFFVVKSLGGLSAEQMNSVEYVLMFLFYLGCSFVTFFFNTAIITTVKRKLEGKENTFWDGMRSSMEHLGKIFQWSLVSAVVSTILRIIESKFDENSIVGRMLISLLWGAWSIMTFFAFPLMIVQGLGPLDAVKESASLFKKTWGERAILNIGSGFFFFILMVFVVITGIMLLLFVSPIFGMIYLGIGIAVLVIVSMLVDVIVKTLLLHYVQTQTLPADENERMLFASVAKNTSPAL